MKQAIQTAYDGINAKDGGPFGAVIVCDGEVMAVAHNRVIIDRDPTAHAEINAIREASKKLGINLSSCEIYSTTEPCPMCFSAINWAGIKKVIFGTKIEDVAELGFREIKIKDETMKFLAKLDIEIVKDFMRDECIEILKHYEKIGGHRY
ncbi:MAG: nucleoside deaminase [Candidatus Altiarchaeota archaeon]|nr:nucleoside deaminase [Candidatus Altiarchaeota archaeon]